MGHVSTHFAIMSSPFAVFLMSAKTDKKQKESHERFQWDRKIGEVLGRKIREKRIRRFEMILKSFITFFFSSVEDIRIYSQGFRTVLMRYGFHVIMRKHYTNTESYLLSLGISP